jgi:hypothetical protein
VRRSLPALGLLAGCRFGGDWQVTEGDPNCLVQEGDLLGIDGDRALSPEPWELHFLTVSLPPARCTRVAGHGWTCVTTASYDLSVVNASAVGSSTLTLDLDRASGGIEGFVTLEHACSGDDCDAVAMEPCGTDGSAPFRMER